MRNGTPVGDFSRHGEQEGSVFPLLLIYTLCCVELLGELVSLDTYQRSRCWVP